MARKRYTQEYKQQAVAKPRRGGISLAQVARGLDINQNMLSRWRRDLEENGSDAFPGEGHARDAEMMRLKRELTQVKKERLLRRIRAIHAASDGVLDRRRIWEDLREEGETASLNRVARLMCAAGLYGVPQRKSWSKKRSGERPTYVKNHLERNFTAGPPNRKWVTDITYIRTREEWLYLCVVIDLHSRPVVG